MDVDAELDRDIGLVGAVARANGATVDLLHVLPPDADSARRAEGEAALDCAANLLADVETERSLATAGDVAGTIVDRTADHDLTVDGATQEGLFQQLVFGATPESVALGSRSTVVMAKRNLGVSARLRGWLYRLRPR